MSRTFAPGKVFHVSKTRQLMPLLLSNCIPKRTTATIEFDMAYADATVHDIPTRGFWERVFGFDVRFVARSIVSTL